MNLPPRNIHALFPELLWSGGGFLSGYGLLIEDDSIAMVATHQDLAREVERRRQIDQYVTERRLAGKALMPGLVNTHSHAFQRAIRGRTEFPDLEDQDNFWKWREVMYKTANLLTPEDVEALALALYVEMVKAGITHLGEFHYLHHQPNGTPYNNPNELADRIIRAAGSAGIRLTMLRAYYRRAGFARQSLEGAQRRFCDPSLDFYLSSLNTLRAQGHKVAVTPHSIRAVPKEELLTLIRYAKEENLPLHMHISEQPREIEESIAEYGCSPVEFIDSIGGLGPNTTLVHAIHITKREIEAIGNNHCSIASCPSTERNLGDGIVKADALIKSGAQFTFGSDSQCQISPFEEARQLEYHLRLQTKERSLLFNNSLEAGKELLCMLTTNGWRSLGGEGGKLATGQPCDLITVDLNHLSIAGWSKESLAVDLVFSAAVDIVCDVWIKGVEIVCDRQHRAQEEAIAKLKLVLNKIRAS